MPYPAVLTQLKDHKNEWWKTSYIVILTRGTSTAAAWQSTELIKRLEYPSLCDSFHSSDEWKV